MFVVEDGKDGDGFCFEKFNLNFSKFSLLSVLRHNQKCTTDYSRKKLIEVLVLNFKAMFSARVKVRRKYFCIVLALKCFDGAPLDVSSKHGYSFMEHSWPEIMIIIIKLFLEKDKNVKVFHLHCVSYCYL